MFGNRKVYEESEYKMSEERANEVYNFLKEIEKKELVLKSYELMKKRHVDYINLTPSNKAICVEKLSPHTIGELVLKKDKGFFTRYYDADMPYTFLSKIEPLEVRFHHLEENNIEEIITRWNKEGISFSDSTASYYHPEKIY
ncbi:MAG: hypothetical protein JXM74_05630 [Fusobacteriaceae bacterium]|nr:hypothetical protein [Fusobacteriaceae bacterium]